MISAPMVANGLTTMSRNRHHNQYQYLAENDKQADQETAGEALNGCRRGSDKLGAVALETKGVRNAQITGQQALRQFHLLFRDVSIQPAVKRDQVNALDNERRNKPKPGRNQQMPRFVYAEKREYRLGDGRFECKTRLLQYRDKRQDQAYSDDLEQRPQSHPTQQN